MEKALLIFVFLVISFTSNAQTESLNLAGNAEIQGKSDISYSTDTTSVCVREEPSLAFGLELFLQSQ